MKAVAAGIGRALRETGQAIDRVGSSLMGQYAFKEELSRHRRIMPLGNDLRPEVGKDSFVAPNASVIGDVKLGERVIIWYGAVLRGDRSGISIGADSSLGDRVVVHTTVRVFLIFFDFFFFFVFCLKKKKKTSSRHPFL